MPSPFCERAVEDTVRCGKALFKILAPNDVKATRSHQAGFYLPRSNDVWKMFTDIPPIRGANKFAPVQITWQCGLVTQSKITWYGAAKQEYRLTCFGKGFPYREADALGNLLVLVIKSPTEFLGYSFDNAEDTDTVLGMLDLQMVERNWCAYDVIAPVEAPVVAETANQCVDRNFRKFAQALEDFPDTTAFSDKARNVILECVGDFRSKSPDDQLIALMEAEYALFKLVERQVCQGNVQRLFADMDDFLKTASSLMNRRKSRAGRSLENHFGYLLMEANIPCAVRAPEVEGRPDVIIPSVRDYKDAAFPDDKLFMVGVKTTCKDRWRQITNEAPRITKRHILTLQQSISRPQLLEMKEAGITLVVPAEIKKQYPEVEGMNILSVQEFFNFIRDKLAS